MDTFAVKNINKCFGCESLSSGEGQQGIYVFQKNDEYFPCAHKYAGYIFAHVPI